MKGWTENYGELYSRENIISETALENTTSLPTMEELDLPPNTEELSKAIDSLRRHRAATKSHQRL